MARPLVTVILPTRDRAHLLGRAVRSMLAQTCTNWELLVLDNNRREPPVREHGVVRAFAADDRVRVLRVDSARSAAAVRNVGLAHAAAPWVSYLDDDDAYHPDKLERQLALASAASPLVLCGARFVLRGRHRVVQCDAPAWHGDDLLLRARWNTPLLLHRHPGELRFDETLSPGEDAEFAHRLLARWGCNEVPVAGEPLVDIFPQSGPRVNADPAPMRCAAARVLAARAATYSRAARRRYVLQTLLGVAKLHHRAVRTAALAVRLLIESRGADWRACANALMVSLRIRPGTWVS